MKHSMRIHNLTSGLLILVLFGACAGYASARQISLRNAHLLVSVRTADGAYEIRAKGSSQPVMISRVAAEVNHRWVSSSSYPIRRESETTFHDALGAGHQIVVSFTGLNGRPELDYVLRLYNHQPYGSIEVTVRNTTSNTIQVQSIRSVEAIGKPIVNFGGTERADRVLSGSFSEDRPPVHIYDLGQEPVYLGWDRFGKELSPVQLGVGSQLIYNRTSGKSLLLAALTSRRWLTLLRLGVASSDTAGARIASYAVDSTGTTEIERRESLDGAPAEDQIELSLPVGPGEELASERLMFATGSNYHEQLEAYGKAIRVLHHARVESPNLMGWWSWAVYFAGVNERDVSENAHWLAKNLKPLGYDYMLIDDGYEYARGDYTKPNPTNFPRGMRSIGEMLHHLGLKLGVWTAPFEVSERAWVYQHHKDWLVHDRDGKPIRIYQPDFEPLYVLDTTNPGAQNYLRKTYQTMVRKWGVRYIKLDFMDDAAIEGYRYGPDVTALEAQRIGLRVIRDAVGQHVLLDKDGSPMLNPVGLVDEGRISLDTSHSFHTTKAVATGIAARYYMNRNFFVSDPDAFEVSEQLEPHQVSAPLTLNEAQASIVLAALSGGMFEIGDNLPLLGTQPARLALLKNTGLLEIVRLERAATPVDLMSYSSQDGQPSIFLLRETNRQTMLAVFNWTDQPRSHQLSLADLGLPATGAYKAIDSLNQGRPVALTGGVLRLRNQPPRSVLLIKIIDTSVPASPHDSNVSNSTRK